MFLSRQSEQCLLKHPPGSQDTMKSIFTEKAHVSMLCIIDSFVFGNGIICSATEKLGIYLLLSVQNGWNEEKWDIGIWLDIRNIAGGNYNAKSNHYRR